MDACERDFLEAGSRHAINFSEHVVDGHASRPAARRWDDAVRTRLAAAGLHAQCEGGPPRNAWLDRRPAASVAVAEPHGGGEVHANERQKLRLLVVENDLA